jgi:hypothetical protein
VNVVFKEWLPDHPALGNPGLIEANNVLPDVDGYAPYKPLVPDNAGSGTLPATARGMFSAFDATGVYRFYGASADLLFIQSLTTNAFVTVSSALASTTVHDWNFAQYENLVFACNHDNTMYHTIGAASNFITSNASKASVVGVVGQFVVVGDLRGSTDRPYTIQWSAVDDPTNWPTPGSATAIATQSGEQNLNAAFGPVQSIIGSDQSAIILQETGITRMTYVGPPAVFQFDEIERSRGAAVKHGAIKAGAVTHFYAADGFYATDGVSVVPTGLGKIDKTFAASVSASANVRVAYNQGKKCVYWSFGEGAATVPNKIYAYHTEVKNWSSADEGIRSLDQSHSSAVYGPYAFDENNVLSVFTGTAGAATIKTGDLEFNEGGRAYVDGVKPHVESAATAPSIGVRIGVRNDLGTTPSYTTTANAHSRTGYANFRNAGVTDGKYHRAEVTIAGEFKKATGFDADVLPSGKA